MGDVSPSADRQSNTGSAVYETGSAAAQRAEEPPAVAALRRAMESDGDLETKTYDIEELNRLKEAANRSSLVLAAGQEPRGEEDDDDNLATGKLNLDALPPEVKAVMDRRHAAEPEEDDPLDDGPTKMRPADDPFGAKVPVIRPAAGARAIAPAKSPAIAMKPEDEDSDDGPTVNHKKGADDTGLEEARAALRGAFAELGQDEDDPLDDGPTRMKPQEAFPFPAGRIPPPPAMEMDRASHTSILDSPRGSSSDQGDDTEPYLGSTARIAGGAMSLRQTTALLSDGPEISSARLQVQHDRMMTSPLLNEKAPTTSPPPPMPPGPLVSPWSASVAPPVAPPMGPPVAPTTPPPAFGPPPALTPTVAPPPPPNRQRLLAALLGVALGLAVLFVYGAFSGSDPESPTNPAASATATASVAEPVKVPVPVIPTASAAPPPSPAEGEAHAALTKLREGIGGCVQKSTTALPEMAPALPSSLKLTRADGFTAKKEDLKASIWSCAKWSPGGAMHYQIQWQSLRPYAEGTAVAWIDNNGDGTADEAFAFQASLKGKGKIEIGEIGPTDAGRKVMIP